MQNMSKIIYFPKNDIERHLPKLVSYACRYSDVINCETNELLPTAGPPNIRTLWRIK